jgi:dipeptidyl aminopeptidase/acylaminoacyl peptidase
VLPFRFVLENPRRTRAENCGDDDRNVPFQQTTDLVEKLRAQKAAFEELIIPDEIHDLLRWNDWVRSYKATADFFDKKLAPTPQP